MIKGFDLWPRRVPMLAHCARCGHARLDHPGGAACVPHDAECGCRRFVAPPLRPRPDRLRPRDSD